MNNNPYLAYKQQSVMTMTAVDMLSMLYDGLIKSLTCATMAFESKDIVSINEHLQKAQAILHYLQNTLDGQYEVASELNALYDYFLHTIVQANVKKDLKELPTLIQMIGELRESYVQADKKLRSTAVVG